MYSCHPWYGDAGVPFTQIFKPDFLAAMAKVSDEFSSLSDHLLQKDYGSPNKGHPGTPQMQLKSQLAYDLRITKAIAMMRSHVENTELRKVEFFSADTDKFCLELFIRHKSITEWNPQQNPAERSHSSILRMIRIVHAAANDAPLCLWPFTANQAASVHNALITRSATAVNPMSSPQMKTGKLADLSKFRVMYCAVSCVVRSSYDRAKMTKISPTAVDAVHLGWDSRRGGYHVYVKLWTRFTTFNAGDCIFRESEFPFLGHIRGAPATVSHPTRVSTIPAAPPYLMLRTVAHHHPRLRFPRDVLGARRARELREKPQALSPRGRMLSQFQGSCVCRVRARGWWARRGARVCGMLLPSRRCTSARPSSAPSASSSSTCGTSCCPAGRWWQVAKEEGQGGGGRAWRAQVQQW